MEERRAAPRKKSFLKGTVYFNNRLSSVECLIRDFSETGARLEFQAPTTLPDSLELYIPTKDQTLRSQVRWRNEGEVGVGFIGARHAVDAEAPDGGLAQRVENIERDLAKLQRVVAEMRNDLRGRRGED